MLMMLLEVRQRGSPSISAGTDEPSDKPAWPTASKTSLRPGLKTGVQTDFVDIPSPVTQQVIDLRPHTPVSVDAGISCVDHLNHC